MGLGLEPQILCLLELFFQKSGWLYGHCNLSLRVKITNNSNTNCNVQSL